MGIQMGEGEDQDLNIISNTAKVQSAGPMNVIGFEGFDPDAAEWDEDGDDDDDVEQGGSRPKKRKSMANLAAQNTADSKNAPHNSTDSSQSGGSQRVSSMTDDDMKHRNQRRKIRIEFIEDKSRRHITFSKRKAGIMKKAYELSTLTGTQVLLLVVSETGLVYTFTTAKLQPLVTQELGKRLIQMCLNTADGDVPNFNKAAMAAAASAAAAGATMQPTAPGQVPGGAQRYVSNPGLQAAGSNPNLAMLSQLGLTPTSGNNEYSQAAAQQQAAAAAAAAAAANSANFLKTGAYDTGNGQPSSRHQLQAQLGIGSTVNADSNHQRRPSEMMGGPLLNKTNRPIAGNQRVASSAHGNLMKQQADRQASASGTPRGHSRMVSSPLNVQLGNLELRSASSSQSRPPHLTLDTSVTDAASSQTEYLLSAMSAQSAQVGQENQFPGSTPKTESAVELGGDGGANAAADSNRQFAELLQSSNASHSGLFQGNQSNAMGSRMGRDPSQTQHMMLSATPGNNFRNASNASSVAAASQPSPATHGSRQLSGSGIELSSMHQLLDPHSNPMTLSPHVRNGLQQLNMQQGANARMGSNHSGQPGGSQHSSTGSVSPDPSGSTSGSGLAMYYDSSAIGGGSKFNQGASQQQDRYANIFAPRAGSNSQLNLLGVNSQQFDSNANGLTGLNEYNGNDMAYNQGFPASPWPQVDISQSGLPSAGPDVNHLWLFSDQPGGELSLSPADREVK